MRCLGFMLEGRFVGSRNIVDGALLDLVLNFDYSLFLGVWGRWVC